MKVRLKRPWCRLPGLLLPSGEHDVPDKYVARPKEGKLDPKKDYLPSGAEILEEKKEPIKAPGN